MEIKAPGSWIYQRRLGKKKQVLCIQKAQNYAGIKFYFEDVFYHITEIVDVARVFSPKLIQIIRRSGLNFIEYQNEKELECIVTEFTDVIIKEVLPIYEKIVRPEQFPTPELEKKFHNNMATYAERFRQRYHMTYETKILQIKKCVRELEQLVDENRGLTGKELDEFLLCSSSYYAELLIRAYKGRWAKEENLHIYFLEFFYKHTNKSNPRPITLASPLVIVFSYWDKPEIYSKRITVDYEELIQRLGLE